MQLVAEEARAGKLFGVWNTDDANGLRLIHRHGRSWLEGRKILASGAGHIERPLVTATDENGRRMIVLPKLGAPDRADVSRWTAHGMRASATGAVDFTGVEIEPMEIVGREGDYERQPWFSVGAWRFAAVHLGGMERLFDLLRRHLQETNRGQDPHQAARLGRAAMAVETARLWVAQAASTAEAPLGSRAPEQLVAYVNLARLAVEAAALELMQLAQRSIGLQAFMRPNPIERISRDLATYLRQPGPGPRADGRGGVGARAAGRRAGSVAMTVGEVLAAAESLPLRPVRDALADRPFIVIAPHPDDESLACGGLIADACRQGVRSEGRHCQRRRWFPSEQQGLPAGAADDSPRGGSETSGRRTGLEARGDAFPPSPRSVRPL